MNRNTVLSNAREELFRRWRPSRVLRRLPDLRPASPLQLAIIGGGVWLVGSLVPALGLLTLVGLVLVLVAGLSYVIRPSARQMYWRGRRLELDNEPTRGERLYRAIYRR